jgi:hypothetical protein
MDFLDMSVLPLEILPTPRSLLQPLQCGKRRNTHGSACRPEHRQSECLSRGDCFGDAHLFCCDPTLSSAVPATNRNNSSEGPSSREAEALQRRPVLGPLGRQFDCL